MTGEDVSWNPDADPRRQSDPEASKFLEYCRELDEQYKPQAIKPKDFSKSPELDTDLISKTIKQMTEAMQKAAINSTVVSDTLRKMQLDYSKEPERAYEVHKMNGRYVRTHRLEDCTGRHCVIHNSTNHAMRGWERNFRDDTKRTERLCKHGIGHPDPDDVAYWVSQGKTESALWTHGCDGCCPA